MLLFITVPIYYLLGNQYLIQDIDGLEKCNQKC